MQTKAGKYHAATFRFPVDFWQKLNARLKEVAKREERSANTVAKNIFKKWMETGHE